MIGGNSRSIVLKKWPHVLRDFIALFIYQQQRAVKHNLSEIKRRCLGLDNHI